jgi:hypothetical protein
MKAVSLASVNGFVDGGFAHALGLPADGHLCLATPCTRVSSRVERR